MKKTITMFLIAMMTLLFTACLDEDSSPSAPSYEYPALTLSSSSVTIVPSSSSVAPVVVNYTPQQNQSKTTYTPSSSSKSITLADVCEEAASSLVSSGTYQTLSAACSDYGKFLQYLGLSATEVTTCMTYEGCSNATVTEQTQPKNKQTIYVDVCRASYECTSGNCLDCMDKIRNQSTSTGTYHSSGTCNKIKQQCFGVYY